MFYVVLAFVLFVVLLAGSGLVISENVSLPGFTAKSEGLCIYGIDRGAERKKWSGERKTKCVYILGTRPVLTGEHPSRHVFFEQSARRDG